MEDISNRHLDFATFEAQSIKDDRNRAKAHGKSCYHWVKKGTSKEVEDTHGHWDRQDIVDKGPKEVEQNSIEGFLAHVKGTNHS